MSTAAADHVVADTVESAHAVFGAEVEALYTLGSLAHGGFAPLVSDIDVAIVLDVTGPDTAGRVAEVQERVVERARGPLSHRLSVFWGDWRAVRTGAGEHDRLGPVDRLDLLDSARLQVGSDLREPCTRPSPEELVVMSADLMLGKFTAGYLEGLRDAPALVRAGPRAVTKAILFPVRFLYTLATGRIGLNEGSVGWYVEANLPGSGLALAALGWRHDGIGEPSLAIEMIDADLATLHLECLTAYGTHLDGLGDSPRAAALAERAACVHHLTPGRALNAPENLHLPVSPKGTAHG